MYNIFISPGHYEFTWKTGSKMIKIGDEIFKEFNDFNIKVPIYLNEYLRQHTCFKIHQLEYDNNKLDMDLRQRINYINSNCGKYGNDLVISIHANYNSNQNLKGVDLFYGSENGKKLCELYKKHSKDNFIKYRKMFKCKFKTWTEFGIVLRVSPVSILIEAGFFSNKEDRDILKKEEYHKQVALSIYKMICEYYKIKPILEEEIIVPQWKIDEVDKAVKYGYIDNDLWKNKIDENIPVWAMFEIVNDIYEDFEQRIHELRKELYENIKN